MQTHRKNERGVTLLLVAICLLVIVSMAALAIDVVSLYVARTEAQRAADAAALAAAKVMVDTGFTSGLALTPTDVCGGGTTSAASQEAIKAAAQNLIAGQPATVQSVACNLNNPQNPLVTVTIQRTALPTFFSRIWGNTGNSVTTSATAEAFNPSGQTSAPPISVASVKPFLVPNCDPGASSAGFPCSSWTFFSGSGNPLSSPSNYIGTATPFTFNQASGPAANQYLVVDMSVNPAPGTGPATICPGTGTPPTNSCSLAGGGGLYDNIACANTHVMDCSTQVTIDPNSGKSTDPTDTSGGINCLIHHDPAQSTVACSSGSNANDQDCFVPPSVSNPVVMIQAGQSNPNPALRGLAQPISRSDSVMTVPVFDATSNPCPSGLPCTVPIIGFLQLGVQSVDSSGNFQAYVLNAAGCGSTGSTPISGGGVSPIPVRLVHN